MFFFFFSFYDLTKVKSFEEEHTDKWPFSSYHIKRHAWHELALLMLTLTNPGEVVFAHFFSVKLLFYTILLGKQVCMCMLSHIQFFVTPWTVAHQAPLLMEFSKQGYWSVLPFLTAGVLPNLETEPTSPALAGRFFTPEPPGKPSPCISHT